jgi:hypothetical protein
MSQIIVYDPNDPTVASRVTSFNRSANTPDYDAETNKLVNPDLSALDGIVPQNYWKVVSGAVYEMTATEKADLDLVQVTVEHVQSVVIQEEPVKTGGSYQSRTLACSVPASAGPHDFNFTFPHPISLLSADYTDESNMVNDRVDVEVGPDVVVGVITADVAVDDTTITVDATSIANCKLGHRLKIDNGVTLDDLGRVTGKTSTTLTFETPAQNIYLAAAPTYVKRTVRMVHDLQLTGSGMVYSIGTSKIGGSYIPAGIVIRVVYTNNDGTSKTYRPLIEYLY